MLRSFAFRTLISLLIIVCGVVASVGIFKGHHLPFTVVVVDDRMAMIYPNAGSALPPGIEPHDQVDLSALDPATRAAMVIQGLEGMLPAGATYPFVLRRNAESISVPVTTVLNGSGPRERFSQWTFTANYAIFAVFALLILWRGRGRAAVYTATWLVAVLFGFVCNYGFESDGAMGMALQATALIFYALARISLYLIIEYSLGAALTPRAKLFSRLVFIVVLVVGTATFLGGPLVFIAGGGAALLRPAYGILFTAGYVVPALVLLFGYGRATDAQRPHLRWLLVSIMTILVGVFFSNTSVLDSSTNDVVQSIFMCLGIVGFAYTVLRHRVVDVSVVVDRTLVYGATTALVVGIVAAMNSLALRATLGEGTGLLLQIVIPLSLGIVLGKVRAYMDRVVERVFFRSKYLAERALKNFARHCSHIEDEQRLLDSAVDEIRRHTKSPAIALYEVSAKGYTRIRQGGEAVYPAKLHTDDPAVVAARAERKPVELADVKSKLGADGCVIPISVLGRVRGVLVLANRPGEHYAADEKKLLAQVVRDVGATWRILRARENEQFVWAVAQGEIKSTLARARAKALASAWSGPPLSA